MQASMGMGLVLSLLIFAINANAGIYNFNIQNNSQDKNLEVTIKSIAKKEVTLLDKTLAPGEKYVEQGVSMTDSASFSVRARTKNREAAWLVTHGTISFGAFLNTGRYPQTYDRGQELAVYEFRNERADVDIKRVEYPNKKTGLFKVILYSQQK